MLGSDSHNTGWKVHFTERGCPGGFHTQGRSEIVIQSKFRIENGLRPENLI